MNLLYQDNRIYKLGLIEISNYNDPKQNLYLQMLTQIKLQETKKKLTFIMIKKIPIL